MPRQVIWIRPSRLYRGHPSQPQVGPTLLRLGCGPTRARGNSIRPSKTCNEAIRLDPMATITTAVPSSMAKEGNHDKGIVDSTEAIRLDPNNPVPTKPAACLISKKATSIIPSEIALRQSASTPNLLLLTHAGSGLAKKGNSDEAIRDCKEAIDSTLDLAGTYPTAAIYYEQGMYDKTIEYCNQGIGRIQRRQVLLSAGQCLCPKG